MPSVYAVQCAVWWCAVCGVMRADASYDLLSLPFFLSFFLPFFLPVFLRYAVRGFAEALNDIPMALAENSGMSPIESLAAVRSQQLAENNPYLGVDCMGRSTNDMKVQHVFETLQGKIQQMQLATQVCKMILKIDDVIAPAEYA